MFDFDYRIAMRAVKRGWKWGLLIAIFAGCLVTFYVIRQPKQYETTAKLEFTSGPEVSLDSRSVLRYSSYVLQNLFLTTQRIVMLSDPMLERVARRMAGGKADQAEIQRLKGTIRGALKVERVPDSQIFLVRARHVDPQVATNIANFMTTVYLRDNYEKKIANYENSMEWLDEELADLKSKLDKSQRRLITFIEEKSYVEKGADNPVEETTERYAETEELLDVLNKKLVEKEILLGNLSNRYFPEHPEYKKLESEIGLLTRKVTQAKGTLTQNKMLAKERAITAKKNEIAYQILKREVEVNKEIYDTLIRKHKEVDITTAVARTDATVIEAATVPSAAVYPNKSAQLFFGWLLSFILGLAFCFVREALDTTIKNPEDIEALVEEPLLAVIPKREEHGGDGVCSFISDEDVNRAESFRVLRVNLNFSYPKGDDGRVIMICSADRNEGKSTVSFNLAAVTAELGKRTVIVDADLRARSTSRFFGYQDLPGLTNILVGEKTLEEVLIKTDEQFWILPAGPMPPKPSSLVDSDYMRHVIEDLRHNFEDVLLDTPPLELVIDGSIISTMVDGVVLVVGAGDTKRAEVKHAIKSLSQAQARISGVVLNKFNEKSRSKYYGRYYGGGYGYGSKESNQDEGTRVKDSGSKFIRI